MALPYKNTWVALSSICAAIICTAPEVYAAQARIGVVGAVNPSLTAVDVHQHSRPLALGDDIFAHEQITSNANGNAQLIFMDKSTLSVGRDASFTIEKFAYDSASASGEMVIYSTKGTYRFIGGALSKEHPVVIKTPVSTVSIKGGIAMVEIDGNTGETKATFAYGDAMTVANVSGDAQTVNEPGYSVGVASDGSPPSEPVKVDAEMLQHTMNNFTSSEGQNGGAVAEVTNGQVAPTMDGEGGTAAVTDNTSGGGVPSLPEVVNSTDTKGAQETRVVTKTNEGQPPKTGGVTGGDTPPSPTPTLPASTPPSEPTPPSPPTNTPTPAPSSTPEPTAGVSAPPPAPTPPAVVALPHVPQMAYMDKAGAMVSGPETDLIMSRNAGGPRCNNCLFADWGVWAADVSDPDAVNLAEVTYYMKGEPTQNLGSISLPAQVNYRGIAVGNTSNALTGVRTAESGTFTAVIDMGNRAITDFNMTYANRVFGFTGQNHVIPATGIAGFSGLAIHEQDGGNALSGTVNGALFGNAAQNIGGNFDFNTIQGGGALHGAGVYVGKR